MKAKRLKDDEIIGEVNDIAGRMMVITWMN
jgi:hypothetical protein